MEKFKLLHVALYAKGWYKKENKKTLWEDLQVMLTLDDYSGEFFSNKDIVTLLLNHCQRLNLTAFKSLSEFAEGISPSSCWKYGYYTKYCTWVKKDTDKLPEYDMDEAIIRYCLSNLFCTDSLTLGTTNLPMPNYVKGLPKPNGVTNKKLKEFFV